MKFFIQMLINVLKFLRPQVEADPGRVRLGRADEFAPGELREFNVNGASVLVARSDGRVCAVENRCPHLGVPMDGGRVANGVITCPVHNSRFDMCTGKNLDWVTGVAGVEMPRWSQQLMAMGQEPRDARAFKVSEENDEVFIDVYVETRG